MVLYIDDKETIASIEDRFARSFPGLKLEIYNKSHQVQQSFTDKNSIHKDSRSGVIRKSHTPANLEIMSWYKIARVRKEFQDRFGWNVQVFRDEHGRWVQDSKTDNYTLREHMDMAQHAWNAVYSKYRIQHNEYEYL